MLQAKGLEVVVTQVSALMVLPNEAGVTSGAFYAHLGSKDGAFEAALAVVLDEVIAAIPEFQQQHGEHWVVAFSVYYLGPVHRENLACGCAMTTLSPEVVRTKPELHAINLFFALNGIFVQFHFQPWQEKVF